MVIYLLLKARRPENDSSRKAAAIAEIDRVSIWRWWQCISGKRYSLSFIHSSRHMGWWAEEAIYARAERTALFSTFPLDSIQGILPEKVLDLKAMSVSIGLFTNASQNSKSSTRSALLRRISNLQWRFFQAETSLAVRCPINHLKRNPLLIG